MTIVTDNMHNLLFFGFRENKVELFSCTDIYFFIISPRNFAFFTFRKYSLQ